MNINYLKWIIESGFGIYIYIFFNCLLPSIGWYPIICASLPYFAHPQKWLSIIHFTQYGKPLYMWCCSIQHLLYSIELQKLFCSILFFIYLFFFYKKQISPKNSNSNCDETQQLKLWWNSKTQIVVKLINSNGDNTQ